jgi:hypothetical protein
MSANYSREEITRRPTSAKWRPKWTEEERSHDIVYGPPINLHLRKLKVAQQAKVPDQPRSVSRGTASGKQAVSEVFVNLDR